MPESLYFQTIIKQSIYQYAWILMFLGNSQTTRIPICLSPYILKQFSSNPYTKYAWILIFSNKPYINMPESLYSQTIHTNMPESLYSQTIRTNMPESLYSQTISWQYAWILIFSNNFVAICLNPYIAKQFVPICLNRNIPKQIVIWILIFSNNSYQYTWILKYSQTIRTNIHESLNILRQFVPICLNPYHFVRCQLINYKGDSFRQKQITSFLALKKMDACICVASIIWLWHYCIHYRVFQREWCVHMCSFHYLIVALLCTLQGVSRGMMPHLVVN
jgi:hypothetical protein